MDEAVTSWFG
jgi:hypothetical protein